MGRVVSSEGLRSAEKDDYARCNAMQDPSATGAVCGLAYPSGPRILELAGPNGRIQIAAVLRPHGTFSITWFREEDRLTRISHRKI